MTSAERGWYPDPENQAQIRFWDGQKWTHRRAPAEQKRNLSEEKDLKKIDEFLELAVAAAAAGNLTEEHTNVMAAVNYAGGWRDHTKVTRERLVELRADGKILVGSEYWGTISRVVSSQAKNREIYDLGSFAMVGKFLSGGLEVRSDRILTPTGVFPYDEHTNAQVFLDGQKQVNYRPSKTAGLLGAILPGTALIPMMAFQVKETDDSRKAEFVAVGSTWSVNRQTPVANVGIARSLAERINSRASQLSSSQKSGAKQVDAEFDPFEKIEKLASLREKGLISEEEFQRKRSDLLDSI